MGAIITGLFGLIVGSFLNVAIHRVPLGISVVRPGSRCPKCALRIGARDNLPLLSYLLLGGRCRGCGSRISLRYPVVEGLTGLLFVAAAHQFAGGLRLASALVLTSVLLALAAIDLEHQLLPNAIVGPASLAGLILSTLRDPGHWWLYPATAAVLGGALLALAAFCEDALGMGDVKMVGMLGCFLGPYAALATLLGALFGAAVGGGLILCGRMARRDPLPFGTFLSLGALVTLYFGPALWRSYLVSTAAWSVSDLDVMAALF